MQVGRYSDGVGRTWGLYIQVFAIAVTSQIFTARATVISTDTFIATNDFSYENQDIVISNCTVTIDGQHAFSSLRVATGSTLTHSPATNGGLNLNLAGDFQIETAAFVKADGRGYDNAGPGLGGSAGSPSSGTGGSYGGYGGVNSSNGIVATPYDSPFAPTSLGSSGGAGTGGSGGQGGGSVHITAAGNAIINGSVSANGLDATNGRSGGGSGGSIWITAQTISGSGALMANGGTGEPIHGGGGGGGRIALQFGTNQFAGSMLAQGGNGWQRGGAGTVFVQTNGTAGQVTFDNGNFAGAGTLLSFTNAADLIVQGRAVALLSATQTVGSVTLRANSSMSATSSNNQSLAIIVQSNATVEIGAAIVMDGCGFPANAGNGLGNTFFPVGNITVASGSGHGGYGGAATTNVPGGIAYGTLLAPATPGSGGRSISPSTSGAGGGVVNVLVAGTLQLDGRISANGINSGGPGGGGASGGSVLVSVGTLSGSGLVAANGGNGGMPFGGGGGGGRIAVFYSVTNKFVGNFTAHGGVGFVAGGAGTVYSKGISDQFGTFVADNGGVAGTNTLLDAAAFNVLVTNGATARLSLSSGTFNSVIIASNAAMALASTATTLTVQSNLTVSAGGALSSDGVSQSGPGTGSTFTTSGSGGGGHAGYGGAGAVGAGGNAYDSSATPSQVGSPGGSGISGSGAGLGGGAIRITVTGPTLINGRLSANATAGSTNFAGGGSGGAIWLTCNGTFSGSGLISADGGNGNTNAGGGGAGRIAVYYPSNGFSGSYSVRGGAGFMSGGAGTVYLKQSNKPLADLFSDNGGVIAGTNTALDQVSSVNVMVSGGANLKASSAQTINSLSVNSNAVFSFLSATITVSSNVSIATGGKVSGDGQNTQNTSGAGGGVQSGSGGGGHAGYGGNGSSSGTGGLAFADSAITPVGLGGKGGSMGSVPIPSGWGGGALHLTVNGILDVQGALTANGTGVTSNNAGGGAGGSLWVTVGTLTGNGQISADGGPGQLPYAGGGGGGRIALTYNNNSFTGTFSAKGGQGFMFGGAGTIYLKANSSNVGMITSDNGNVHSTNTVINGSGTFDLTVANGAVVSSAGTPRDVFIRTNGVLSQTGAVTISRNFTLDSGGAVNVDAINNNYAGIGAGYGASQPLGGGGHGGYGALNPTNFGGTSDSVLAPVGNGSPGGNGSGFSLLPYGGFGGGAIHLSVPGVLTVNGRISADGGNGGPISGGGAGGSVWLDVGTLTGNGQISASGGMGDRPDGGGGGGRIAITYNSNLFAGTISACGGTGAAVGGAGTIYLKNNTQSAGTLLINNCGLVGTNTPLSSTSGVAPYLQVSSGAIAELQSGIPVFSNITVAGGSALTSKPSDAGLYVGVTGDVLVDSTSFINADGKGNAAGTGVGAGNSLSSKGSGAGYGGAGGASASGAIGGVTNGSLSQPFSFGSGGGLGSGPSFGNSGQGGGLVRLSVGGTLDLEGRISAAGNPGLQDDSGGGSGGSIWLTASRFTGGGTVGADGADGDLYGGGGGGGGRIAIYSPANTFTGLVSVAAGDGAAAGQTGTVFTASALLPFNAVGSTPTNSVSNTVSSIDVTFTDAINPASATASAFTLFTPAGPVAQSNVTVTTPTLNTVRFSFPTQNYVGNYRVEVGPGITDVFGSPMSQVYTGYFSITLPTITGQVTDTNGQPVSGVLLQPGGGLQPAATDVTGAYTLGVPIGWNGTVVPTANNAMFIPSSRAYSNVVASITNENYVEVPTIAATLQINQTGTNSAFAWRGYTGVNYQIYSSSNLVNWVPVGGSIPGTNAIIQFAFPMNQPQQFFRIISQD